MTLQQQNMIFWKIVVITTVAILSFNSVFGQRTRIIFNSSNVPDNIQDTLLIKSIRIAFWSDSIIVKLKNKQKLVFGSEDIWGYQSKDKSIYRYYNGEFIEVRKIDTLNFYSKKRYGYKSSHTDYYLSKTLDSEMFKLTTRNLKKYFSDNPCFIGKINNELKWYQDYSSFDKSKGTFRIIEFYKSCGQREQNE